MIVRFQHTGRRSNQLFDLAEKHGVQLMSGRDHPGGIYSLRASGKPEDEARFGAEVRRLPYVTEVREDEP